MPWSVVYFVDYLHVQVLDKVRVASYSCWPPPSSLHGINKVQWHHVQSGMHGRSALLCQADAQSQLMLAFPLTYRNSRFILNFFAIRN